MTDFCTTRDFAPDWPNSSGLRHSFARSAGWMMRLVAGFVLAALLAISAPARATAVRVMVFGDSLSAAYGISPKEGWVALFETAVKAEGITVINASVSGETSGGGLSRIKTDLARNRPDIVILALGANDGLRGLPVRDLGKNLQAMIGAIQASRARVVLTGMQIPPNYGLDYAREFRDLYPALAARNKTILVPFLLEGIADKLELFQADRLHPIAAAQPRILQNVLPAVRQALKTANPAASARTAAAAPKPAERP